MIWQEYEQEKIESRYQSLLRGWQLEKKLGPSYWLSASDKTEAAKVVRNRIKRAKRRKK